jgi:hypothetical protein
MERETGGDLRTVGYSPKIYDKDVHLRPIGATEG